MKINHKTNLKKLTPDALVALAFYPYKSKTYVKIVFIKIL